MRFEKLTRSDAVGLARQKGGALGALVSLGVAFAFCKLTGSWSRLTLYVFAAIGAVLGGFIAGRRAGTRYDETQRTAKHLCTKCGYDLTGNVSGVCPECGMAISLGQPDPTPRVRVYDGELDLKATIVFGCFLALGIVLMVTSGTTFGLGLLMTWFFGVGTVVGALMQIIRRRSR